MTQRFLDEPFERNPVLQYAAINHLMTEEHGKNTRVLAIWSKKLEALGWWYDQLLSESLGKQGVGRRRSRRSRRATCTPAASSTRKEPATS